jgi:8-oxo-dGTP pyrophosphatase MutT (NUDIX family)
MLSQCQAPIISYGIIGYIRSDQLIRYLMVQKKDTIAFIEFIRGKYSHNNIDYIIKLLNNMTVGERHFISAGNFDALWSYLWKHYSNGAHLQYYNSAKSKMNKLLDGIDNNGNKITLLNLLANITGNSEEPWEFPKGRTELDESPLDCAIREFTEETGFNINCNIIDTSTEYIETYIGMNNTVYKTVYYIADLSGIIPYDYDYIVDEFTGTKHQLREIKRVSALSYKDVRARYNGDITRLNMISAINRDLYHIN